MQLLIVHIRGNQTLNHSVKELVLLTEPQKLKFVHIGTIQNMDHLYNNSTNIFTENMVFFISDNMTIT